MADNSFKINKSANFNPQPGLPANPVNGDFYYDGNLQSFVYYHNGFWANFDSVGLVTATDPMTSAQFTSAVMQNSVVKITGNTTPTHLVGMMAQFSAKEITIYNGGTSYITVEHEDAGEATANNRIHTPTAGDMNLIAGEIAKFVYDIVQNRWLLVSISSQAGAQLIATTTSPGLVTLHQASLFPFDGIVFSDGDKDTATGIVGLDVNKAVSLNPINNADALTINAATNGAGIIINGASGNNAMRIIGNAASPALSVTNTGAVAGHFTGGVNSWGVSMIGGSGGAPGGVAYGTGTAVAFNALGTGATQQNDLHVTNGVVGLYSAGGSAGGDGLVSLGAGAGYAGIHAYGGTGGYGIVADAGSGGIYAGIFNGAIHATTTGQVDGLMTVGGLSILAGGGITQADGFLVSSGTGNVSTTGTMSSTGNMSTAGMLSVDTGNAFNGTWTTTSKSLHFGGTSGEGIGSKRTAGGNVNGLDFYTNNLSRMNITNGGTVNITNDLNVGGALILTGNLQVNALTALANITADNDLLCVFDTIIDSNDAFTGTFTTSQSRLLRFGAFNSGEAIGSKRTSGGNQDGLDLYTNYTSRISISNAGAVTIPGPTSFTNANSIFANSISSVGSNLNINTSTTNLFGTLICHNNISVYAGASFGDGGGSSYVHCENATGLIPSISIGGAKDPFGSGDTNGGFWFGSSNNLTGNGTTWRLNISIGGFVYSWNVDNVWAITGGP